VLPGPIAAKPRRLGAVAPGTRRVFARGLFHIGADGISVIWRWQACPAFQLKAGHDRTSSREHHRILSRCGIVPSKCFRADPMSVTPPRIVLVVAIADNAE